MIRLTVMKDFVKKLDLQHVKVFIKGQNVYIDPKRAIQLKEYILDGHLQ